jgi:hypothetical protein
MIVALDACIVIYLIEGGSPLGDVARARFRELLRDPAGRAVAWLGTWPLNRFAS